MNLHPDCEVALGLLAAQSRAARLLDRLNAWHMRRADATVALGECMAARIRAKEVPADRVAVMPLWAHGVDRPPIPPTASAVRARWGLGGKFVVMYSGNAGVEYTFDEFCAAALALRDDPRFVFVFVGGGRRTAEIDRFRRAHQLSNIHFHPYVPRDELHATLSAADVHLACLRPELAGVSVPCKLYGIMAGARPVLFVGPTDCATAQAIQTFDCGRTFALGDVNGLVHSLRELAIDSDLRTRLGTAGYRAYQRTFNAPARCDEWMELLERVTAASTVVPEAREMEAASRSPVAG
jgi:glycosyltransferase involved in cell wall biosynthesis